jgi:hypothetical protein
MVTFDDVDEGLICLLFLKGLIFFGFCINLVIYYKKLILMEC